MSLGLALDNMSKKFNFEYIPKHYQPGQWHIDDVEPTNDDILVFFIYETKREPVDFQRLLQKCPNAKTVQISCDGQDDFGVTGYYNPEYINIHLDLIEEYADRMNEKGVKSELFWWTISEKTLDVINTSPDVERNLDFICLCRICTYEREWFFNQISTTRKIIAGINCNDMHQVVSLYKRTKFTLGITHSTHSGHPKRSIKAFRDWIGPLCGSMLVYDDHPQICKYFSNFVPIYRYNEIDSLLSVTDFIRENQEQYDLIVQHQQDWIKNNFIETQLLKIFTKYNLMEKTK